MRRLERALLADVVPIVIADLFVFTETTFECCILNHVLDDDYLTTKGTDATRQHSHETALRPRPSSCVYPSQLRVLLT